MIYLASAKNTKSRLLRWAIRLQGYTFSLEHLKGNENFSDIVSRAFTCNLLSRVGKNREQVTPSREDIPRILAEYHMATGHGSPRAMKYLILTRYEWRGANRDINNFVASCMICQRNARCKTPCLSVTPIKAREVNELWEMDLVGPIDDSCGAPYRLFTIIDVFSKRAQVEVILGKKAETILSCLKKVVQSWGKPASILCDNGLEFANKLVANFCTDLCISLKHGAPYKPSTQGGIERFNQTFMNKLRKLSENNEDGWKKQVPAAIDAYNNAYARSIGATPNELFGIVLTAKIDEKYNINTSAPDIKEIRAKARLRLQSYQEEYRKTEKHTLNSALSVGDKVLYVDPSRVMGKLDPRWPSSATILEVHFDSFRLQCDDGREVIANRSQVKRIL